MEILLDKDFILKSDKKNLVLERRSEIENKEDGTTREIWVNDGYYTSIGSLLHGYLKKSVMKSAAITLEELSEDIKRIENKIEKYIGGSK